MITHLKQKIHFNTGYYVIKQEDKDINKRIEKSILAHRYTKENKNIQLCE